MLPPTLVREKLLLATPATAEIAKVPAVAFAVRVGAVATPIASASTRAVARPPAKTAEAPPAGAVNVTATPDSGRLAASRTSTDNGVAKFDPMIALCAEPLRFKTLAAAAPGSVFSSTERLLALRLAEIRSSAPLPRSDAASTAVGPVA